MNPIEDSTSVNALQDMSLSIARMVAVTRREWLSGDTDGEYALQGRPGAASSESVRLLTRAPRQSQGKR